MSTDTRPSLHWPWLRSPCPGHRHSHQNRYSVSRHRPSYQYWRQWWWHFTSLQGWEGGAPRGCGHGCWLDAEISFFSRYVLLIVCLCRSYFMILYLTFEKHTCDYFDVRVGVGILWWRRVWQSCWTCAICGGPRPVSKEVSPLTKKENQDYEYINNIT